MTWSTRRFAIFCAPWIAVRTARSHSSIAAISPKAMPRERVLAAPITRKAPWRQRRAAVGALADAPRARTAAPGRRPSRCRCRAPRSRRAGAPSRAAPASPAAPRRAARLMHPLLPPSPAAAPAPPPRARSAAASAAAGRACRRPSGRARAGRRRASSAITRASAATGSASGSRITWSRSSTRSQRRSPTPHQPADPRRATGRASSSSASASGTCAVGARRRRSAAGRGGAGGCRSRRRAPRAGRAARSPSLRAPDHHRHPLDRADLQHAARQRPHPRALDRVERLDPVAHRADVELEARRPAGCTKAATRIASARSRLTSGTAIAVMTNCGRSTIASRSAVDRGAGAAPRRSSSAEQRPGGERRRRASARRS